jgi:hypothetical protein
MLLSGCVSAWILETGKPEHLSSRREIIQHYRQPVSRGLVSDGSKAASQLLKRYPEAHYYELYQYRGLVQDEQGASGAATANAITLGAGEAIALPFALLDRATGFRKEHSFVAGYGQDHRFMTFFKLPD